MEAGRYDLSGLACCVLGNTSFCAQLSHAIERGKGGYQDLPSCQHALDRFLVQKVAMLDGIHAGCERIEDALQTLGMRRHLTSGLVGFFDRRLHLFDGQLRSEERRVGKECRSRWSP